MTNEPRAAHLSNDPFFSRICSDGVGQYGFLASIDVSVAIRILDLILTYPTRESEVAGLQSAFYDVVEHYWSLPVREIERRSNLVTKLAEKLEAFLRKCLFLKNGPDSDWKGANVWGNLGSNALLNHPLNAFLSVSVEQSTPQSVDELVSFARELRNREAHGSIRLSFSAVDRLFEIVVLAYLLICHDGQIQLAMGRLPSPDLAPLGRLGGTLSRYYRRVIEAYQQIDYVETDLGFTATDFADVVAVGERDNDGEEEHTVSGLRLLAGDERLLILLGAAGTGKTTLLKRYMVSSMNRYLELDFAVAAPPIMVKLSMVRETILGYVSREVGCDEDSTRNVLELGCTLLVDGLDEVDEAHQGALLKELHALSELSGRLRIVLTSRPQRFKNVLRWTKYELMPLTVAQAKEICNLHLSSDATMMLLEHNSGWLSHLFRNPLLLRMLCNLYLHENRLPTDLFDLYSYVSASAAQREWERGTGEEPSVAVRNLESIAVRMMDAGSTTLSISDLRIMGVSSPHRLRVRLLSVDIKQRPRPPRGVGVPART